jgi:hypothetical protein
MATSVIAWGNLSNLAQESRGTLLASADETNKVLKDMTHIPLLNDSLERLKD